MWLQREAFYINEEDFYISEPLGTETPLLDSFLKKQSKNLNIFF